MPSGFSIDAAPATRVKVRIEYRDSDRSAIIGVGKVEDAYSKSGIQKS
jgi:hypothetical protein